MATSSTREIAQSIRETSEFGGQVGWFFVIAVMLKAYSLGGGTYTGIEAVSNNVNMLKEPQGPHRQVDHVHDGAFAVGHRRRHHPALPAVGRCALQTSETLNAIVFREIISSIGLTGSMSHLLLVATLAFEGALLFVAANTGFLGGPAVLANMAVDRWAPNQFSALSSRLVTRNGVLLMGVAALAILLWTARVRGPAGRALHGERVHHVHAVARAG